METDYAKQGFGTTDLTHDAIKEPGLHEHSIDFDKISELDNDFEDLVDKFEKEAKCDGERCDEKAGYHENWNQLFCENCRMTMDIDDTKVLSESIKELKDLNNSVKENFTYLLCAQGYTAPYLPKGKIADEEKTFDKLKSDYLRLYKKSFKSGKVIKISNLKTLVENAKKNINQLRRKIYELGEISMKLMSKEMLKDAKKEKADKQLTTVVFHTKLCLKEENEIFLNQFEQSAVKDYNEEMDSLKEENKAIKDHTPYCYSYHDEFFKTECQHVDHKVKNSDKVAESLSDDSSIRIDLGAQFEKTRYHLIETRIPNLWGFHIENIQKLPGDEHMTQLISIIPKRMKQFSLVADENEKATISDKNIKILSKAIGSNYVEESFKFEGFKITDSNFNKIISNSGHLKSLHITKCEITPEKKNEEADDVELKIDFRGILDSNSLNELILTGNNFPKLVVDKIMADVAGSKLKRRLTKFET